MGFKGLPVAGILRVRVYVDETNRKIPWIKQPRISV